MNCLSDMQASASDTPDQPLVRGKELGNSESISLNIRGIDGGPSITTKPLFC